MNTGRTVFSQLLVFLDRYQFSLCVDRYKGDYKVRSFSCWEQFLSMCFAQLTCRESLRDIEACLSSFQNKLYHSGIKSKVARSTLADANERRSWHIYADFCSILIREARALYANENDFLKELDGLVYAFDSSTIDLCLSLFPWASFRENKAGIKIHALLDLKSGIPAWITITNALSHDVNMLDVLPVEPGAYYVMDRGYVDFVRLFRIEQARAFFITRAKKNLSYIRISAKAIDKSKGLICDQTIKLRTASSKEKYPSTLRRISYKDEKTGKRLVFITNNFNLDALTICLLYKERWKVELFFKWIKQHLRIKAFYGTSLNAVCTQIWIAVCVFVLVAIVKNKMKINKPLYSILQVLSLTLFEKAPLNQLLNEISEIEEVPLSSKQLTFFDL